MTIVAGKSAEDNENETHDILTTILMMTMMMMILIVTIYKCFILLYMYEL